MGEPKPPLAATVLVVRERKGSLQVLCVRRHPNQRVWGGVVAFPGGKVDPEDATAPADAVHPRIFEFSDDPTIERACAVAAARELFEETALLPTDEVEMPSAPGSRSWNQKLRLRYQPGRLWTLLASSAIELRLSQLVPVSRWVTPPMLPVRFDTRFFAMRMPLGQEILRVGTENMDCFWAFPDEILDQFERHELEILPPTQWMLFYISKFNSLDKFFEAISKLPLHIVIPEIFQNNDRTLLVLPGHPGHSQRPRVVVEPTYFEYCLGQFIINRKN